MGIHDREYYRSEASDHFGGGMHGARSWSVVTQIIVVTAAVYVLDLFIGNRHWLMENLAATPASLAKPYLWWQLLTYGFAHSTRDISHIFWNMFGLWVFGRQVEQIYGRQEFLRIYLVSMLLGGIAWAARVLLTGGGGSLVGASGAVTTMTLLFCIHYPKQTVLLMMVLPIPAWVLGVMIIAGNLFGLRASGENIAFDVHLVGAAFAIVYYRLGWRLGRWWPHLSWPQRLKNPFTRQPKLRVHRPREENETDDNFEQLAARADELLQKVNQHGFDSLSAEDRRVLENYSRRVRNRRH